MMQFISRSIQETSCIFLATKETRSQEWPANEWRDESHPGKLGKAGTTKTLNKWVKQNQNILTPALRLRQLYRFNWFETKRAQIVLLVGGNIVLKCICSLFGGGGGENYILLSHASHRPTRKLIHILIPVTSRHLQENCFRGQDLHTRKCLEHNLLMLAAKQEGIDVSTQLNHH